jgi:tRNA threonylcarbamoyladenosine biosynthesis protein TsaE
MTGPQPPAQPGRPQRPAQPQPGMAEDDGKPDEPGVDELLRVPTAEQMRALGRRLAGLLRAGDLVLLSGPLGAGKTTLTQGIGAGLGVRGAVTSPTFVIARVHPSLSAGPDLVHADAYRLGSRAEVDDLDLDTDLATAITVVEWGEGLVEDLAPSFLSVRIWADEPADADLDDATLDDGTLDDDTGADIRRTVQVRGWGERWRDPAVADATRLALADAN